jgi:hypothetical protein
MIILSGDYRRKKDAGQQRNGRALDTQCIVAEGNEQQFLTLNLQLYPKRSGCIDCKLIFMVFAANTP